MLYNVFKMFVGRLLLISVLLYNTEATFDDEYDGGKTVQDIKMNETILVEDKTLTNLKDATIDDWYPDGYESSTVEIQTPASSNSTTNLWSYGSDTNKKTETWNYESGYEKKNYTTKIVWPYNRFNETVTTTKRPYYSNRYGELENDKNTTGTSYRGTGRYHQTIETARRPYDSNRYDRRRTEGINTSTIRRKYYVSSRWRKGPRDLTPPAPYGYNDSTNDTMVSHTNTTTKHYGYWDGQWWNRPRNLTTPAPYGYVVRTNNATGYNITTTNKNYNRVIPVSPINKTNSSDRNVTNKATTDRESPKTSTSGRNPVNILINSSFNANQSRINDPFTDFLKKISGYILPTAKYVAPNSNVTNLAVAEGNGNSFFYAQNLIVG